MARKYRNQQGDIAIVGTTADQRIRLVLKHKDGTVWKDRLYQSPRGAKTALGMSGPWIGFNPQG